MKTTLKKLTYIILLLSLSSCREYVEIDLVGKRELKYTQDYQNMLNSSTNVLQSYYYPIIASDDIYSTDEAYLNRLGLNDANAYTWNEYIVGDNEEDQDWAGMYKQIYLFNLINEEIMNSLEGTENQKRNVLAQAKVHRALNYFYLVNMYAKQYDAATAASDLGVPLLTRPDLYAPLDRKPVQQVYDQIIEDLTTAIPDLPIKAEWNVLASQGAAEGILARVYLQMGDYEKALQYANSVLEKQNGLVDLQAYVSSSNTYPSTLDDPEELFLKGSRIAFPTLALNPDLLDLFAEGDLRDSLFTAEGDAFGTWNAFEGKGYWKHRIITTNATVTNGPTVPEMLLIKAEVLARNPNTFKEALPVLNELRQHRFLAEAYKPLDMDSQRDILYEVINERRRELMAKGLRWFDQKRLANEGFIGTKTRTFKGETYTLEPNSNRYVFPIASKYIVLNPEIKQNPR